MYADLGDVYPGPDGKPISAEKGQLLGSFPVSNHTAHEDAPVDQENGHGIFPPGENIPITGIEGPSGMGPRYPVFRGQGVWGRRYTWVHSGRGNSGWRHLTWGCIRARESDINSLVHLLRMNDRNGNGHLDIGDGHRVTVIQKRKVTYKPKHAK